MSAILIYGWEVPDWAEVYFVPDAEDVDYDHLENATWPEGEDIENVLPADSRMIMEHSKVSNHTPNTWIFGFKDSKQIAENGNCTILIPDMKSYSKDDGKELAKLYKIPITGEPTWYLLDCGDD